MHSNLLTPSPSPSHILNLLTPSPNAFQMECLSHSHRYEMRFNPYDLGPCRFGSEAIFVPCVSGTISEEDDGYLILFVHDEHTGKSAVNVVDAKTMSSEPVAVVELPHRVPYGFHAFFVTEAREAAISVQEKSVDLQRKKSKVSLRKLDEQPEWLKGGKLRDYQLEGLNFLVNRMIEVIRLKAKRLCR
ncbi:carotenoid 9,10(9',10')-cleavage dioxygenase 1 isoform X2 [Cucumis melo var. makuwa]|uniref:carotenoid 9,10-dioxygenase n=1 Tax=Cucumis melo var. makuwa TaxID=1194695 RepID=A0A5D3D8D7_CUCMM|nr:carotenoid 9,10(9',10')-cleavage dioxygenase 1 isoform X2 [Cucumis melo var. makuwa]TYK19699.1 carotenoid 9,10(9',10')-cleavage dioxygenase 1 isoform X2 [Cucumis melo var. makuwa]